MVLHIQEEKIKDTDFKDCSLNAVVNQINQSISSFSFPGEGIKYIKHLWWNKKTLNNYVTQKKETKLKSISKTIKK